MFVAIVIACALLAFWDGAILEGAGLALFALAVAWWLASRPPRDRARWFVRW